MIPVRAAGPLAEPVAVAIAAVLLAVRAARAPASTRLLPLESALIAYVVLLLVPAVFALGGGAGPAVVLIERTALGPFLLVAALLAALAALVLVLIARAGAAGAGRPRWPWESDDEP